MELRTAAVSRVLEALSPALSAEIERIAAETRESLEVEFQKRLEDAVRSAETSARTSVEAEIEHSVSEAREKVRQQITEELQAQFRKTLEETTSQLRSQLEDEFRKASANWSRERAQLQDQAGEWRVFAEAQPQLAEAASQVEILSRFLKLTEPFAAAIAVYVSKADGLALWKSRGNTAFPDIISSQTVDPESFFKLIVVREKPVAAVSAPRPYRADALLFLCGIMERAIEIFGMKLRAPVMRPPVPQPLPRGAGVAAAAQAAPSADELQVHAEARKTARLLISEIKLYHETEVREGRANSDLYQRLRKEIDRGRNSYNQQVPRTLTTTRDYFHEELIRILTENDPSRLGEAYPGPTA